MKEKLILQNQLYTKKVQGLLSEMATYSEQQLNAKADPKSWSALQVAQHLAVSEASSLAYVRKKMAHTQTFPKAGIAELARSFFIRLLLFQPFKFKAPPVVGNAVLSPNNTLEVIRQQWLNARQDWQEFFEAMPRELENKAVFKHPRAGRIGWKHVLCFFSDHFDRHRQQIRKTLKKVD